MSRFFIPKMIGLVEKTLSYNISLAEVVLKMSI